MHQEACSRTDVLDRMTDGVRPSCSSASGSSAGHDSALTCSATLTSSSSSSSGSSSSSSGSAISHHQFFGSGSSASGSSNFNAILQPLDHQVGGHTQLMLLDQRTVAKPLIQRELLFYLNIPRDLRPFVPAYKGTSLFSLTHQTHLFTDQRSFITNVCADDDFDVVVVTHRCGTGASSGQQLFHDLPPDPGIRQRHLPLLHCRRTGHQLRGSDQGGHCHRHAAPRTPGPAVLVQ